jgi:hypothetical protein
MFTELQVALDERHAGPTPTKSKAMEGRGVEGGGTLKLERNINGRMGIEQDLRQIDFIWRTKIIKGFFYFTKLDIASLCRWVEINYIRGVGVV